ncbi:MAG: M20/M25/M40 family metallo-hydrolase [Romboutsia sp.]|uniref:M20/M25/M40 family metallo-hydrolase n=1 Tax=Romboutsia sp. TaxID=1965302 RepID=UPI003F3EF17D
MFKLNKKILSTSMVLMLTASSLGIANAQSKSSMCEQQKTFLSNISGERAVDYVKSLSEDIGVRIAGTEKEYEAALFIEDEFKKLGYTAEVQAFEYVRNGETKTSWNVEAIRTPDGNDAADSNEIVYVTAHYDSVAKAPGANDNASGVAAMLEIANSIQNMDIDREVRFIACGAEEVGLKGSQAYVNSLSEDEKARSVGTFNLDMVATAYDPASELAVYTSNGQRNVITDAVAEVGSRLNKYSTQDVNFDGEHELTPDGKLVAMGSSDHVPFTQAGIPAALFINVNPSKKHDPRSAIEPYYHKPEDQTQNLSPERLERTIALIGSAIYETVDTDHEEAKYISIDNMIKDLEVISSKDNARVTGFEGEHKAADYLVNEFKEAGLKTRKQIIKDISGFIGESSSIKEGDKALASQLFTYSNATNGVVEGDVVYAGLGTPQELESIDVRGKIALIQRGDISFGEKVENASNKGAKAVIIYNNAEGNLSGTLGGSNLKLAPSASITKAAGEELVNRLQAGEKIKLSIENKTEIEENSYSYNVIANLPSAKNPRGAQTIVVGAHMDGVQCAAANDNATGTVSIVEAARILSQPEIRDNLNYNIEFVAFGAEEIGLIGSKEYVKTLQDSGKIDNVKAMINLDMVGVGNNLVMYNSNDQSSHEVTELAKKIGDELGYLNADTARNLHSTSSDHAPFEAVGVPSTFLTYRMNEDGKLDPYYHKKSDKIETVSPQFLYNTTDVVVNMVLEMQNQDPRKASPTSLSNYSVDDIETEEFLNK